MQWGIGEGTNHSDEMQLSSVTAGRSLWAGAELHQLFRVPPWRDPCSAVWSNSPLNNSIAVGGVCSSSAQCASFFLIHCLTRISILDNLFISIRYLFVYSIYLLIFLDKVSLCNSPSCPIKFCRPDWPQTHRDSPASASGMLELKACATTARLDIYF